MPGTKLRYARALQGTRQAHGFEPPDEIPADVRLPPAQTKARRACMSVVILMPILAPGGELKRAEPPYVLAGIAFGNVIEVRQAVHKTLHVEGVHQANRAQPEKSHPSEAQDRPNKDGQNNYRRFRVAPDFINAAIHFGSPALTVCRRRLIQPAQMGPPEATLFGAGNVVRSVSSGMMLPVISDPAGGMTGSVEYRPENQHLLDEAISLQSFVREHAMVADGRSKSAKSDKKRCKSENFKAGQGKQNYSHDGQHVN